jgi:hypothetical protein
VTNAISATGGKLTFDDHFKISDVGDIKWMLRAAASVLYFVLVGCVSLSQVMGDCFPIDHHVCPTDAERDHRILIIRVVGLSIYLALRWFLLRREKGR